MRALAPAMAALLLAGCTVEPPALEEGPDPDSLPAPPSPTGDPAGNLTFDAAPVWQKGQWWRYRVTGGANTVDTRAVTGESGNAYLVGTDSATTAYFEARFDISTVGRVRKADLAGEQAGSPVLYYQWPLAQNTTWTTLWDGVLRTVRVLGPQTANIGGKSFPALALEAREGDRVTVRYNYVPAAGWFTFAEFLDQGGETFRLEVTAFGQGYNGTLVEARVTDLYRDAASGPLKPQGTFNVPSGTSYLDAQGSFQGDAVAFQLTFRAPDGTLHQSSPAPPCTANCSVAWNATLPGLAGDWVVLAQTLVQGGQARAASASLSVAAVELTSRPLT